MRQRSMLTGLDMEQHSQSFLLPPDIPPLNTVSSFESYDNNNSMFYGLPQSHQHQRPSILGPAMSTPPNFHLPFHAPGSHEHERDAQFVGHGYKRKIAPGNFQYLNTAEAAPFYFQPETAPFSLPQYGTSYPQPVDQRSAGAAKMDLPLSHGHNNFIQGSYEAHPFPPPASLWYNQHRNGSSSSFWPQPPSVPYMHGNVVTGSIDSSNVYFPRYHETSSSRNHTPFVYPRHNHFSYHPAPPPHLPPTVYPHLASASYTVHDASYSHVGPVQSTRFRAFPTDEVAVFGEGDFYDDVDHHQDMRLDIEDMSYEELLALSDLIGTVKTGLSEEDVEGLLKRRTSLCTRINLEEAPSTDLETD